MWTHVYMHINCMCELCAEKCVCICESTKCVQALTALNRFPTDMQFDIQSLDWLQLPWVIVSGNYKCIYGYMDILCLYTYIYVYVRLCMRKAVYIGTESHISTWFYVAFIRRLRKCNEMHTHIRILQKQATIRVGR